MRVAFAGLGFASRKLHLPAVRSIDGIDVAGAADPSADSRNAWTRTAAGPVFEDLDELLTKTAPEILVVASPPESHADVCLRALEAGAHVLCEKPFVTTIAEANRVLERARDADRIVAVNHEFRYMPIFADIRPLLGTTGVGRPVFLQFVQLMDMPPWDEEVPWRAAMSNRTLFEGGVHIVDLMLMLLGAAPVSVSATTSSGLDGARTADAIHLVTVDFGGGLLGQITIDRLCRSATRYLELRLDCEEASIRASLGGRAFVRIGLKRAASPGLGLDFGLGGLAWIERGTKRSVIARNPLRAARRATGALWTDLLDAINRGVEPATSARTALTGLRVIEAAYRSAQTGERVDL